MAERNASRSARRSSAVALSWELAVTSDGGAGVAVVVDVEGVDVEVVSVGAVRRARSDSATVSRSTAVRRLATRSGASIAHA